MPNGEIAERAGLATVVETSLSSVAEQLARTTTEAGYLAIARLSGHLATMRHCVYTPLRKRTGPSAPLIVSCCAESRRLEWALRLLEGRLAGDAFSTAIGLRPVYAQVTERLGAYRLAEQATMAWIEQQLTEAERSRLAARYLRLLPRAPTRPHPWSPRTGLGCWFAFTWHGLCDRVLDTTDSRPGVGAGFL